MQPILQKKEKETEELLVRVERDRKDAAVRRDAAAADAAVARAAREEVQAIKDECQSELNQAMPAYYAAVKALETLDKKSITEVKSYVNPPAPKFLVAAKTDRLEEVLLDRLGHTS